MDVTFAGKELTNCIAQDLTAKAVESLTAHQAEMELAFNEHRQQELGEILQRKDTSIARWETRAKEARDSYNLILSR